MYYKIIRKESSMRTIDNLFTDNTAFSYQNLTYHILNESDTEHLKYLFDQPLSDMQAQFMMKTLLHKAEKREMLCYGVYSESEMIGVMEIYDIHAFSFEIGYRIRPDRRNHGYGTAMVKGFLSYVRDVKLTGIRARVHTDNTASMRILEHNGFELKERTDRGCLYEVKP